MIDENTTAWVKKNITIKRRQDNGTFKEIPTDSFGEIDFKGVARKSRAKFIRLSDSSLPTNILTLITNHWRVKTPRLLITISGVYNTRNFEIPDKHKSIITTGLQKVAKTKGVWFLTHGISEGMSKCVGKALKDLSTTCIGIVPYERVENLHQLKSTHKGNFGGNFAYLVPADLIKKGVFLDSNHTHHLLVDGDDKAIQNFKSNFVKYILDKTQLFKVPSVYVLYEGDVNTLDEITSFLANGSTVILVKGGCKLSDLIIYSLKVYEKYGTNKLFETLVKEKMFILFSDLSAVKRQSIFDRILACIQKEKNFIVFDIKKDAHFDRAVFTAFLDNESGSPIGQLISTIIWNRPDLAKEKVLMSKNNWTLQMLELAMVIALALDRIEFVILLMDNGVSMESFLTNDLLEFLYGFAAHSSTSLLKYVIDVKEFKPISTSFKPEHYLLIERVCNFEGIDIKKSTIPRKKIEHFIKKVCKRLQNDQNQAIIENVDDIDSYKQNCVFAFPFRELFFWAVTNNRHNMALYLWQFEEEGISKALIAAELNRVFAKRAQRLQLQEVIGRSCTKAADEFRALAFQLLDACSRTDECRTIQTITTEFKQFPDQTCLDIAIDTFDLDFVAHASVQLLLNELWSGYLKKRSVSTFQMICVYFFPFYINQFEFYSEEAFHGKYFVCSDENLGFELMCETKDEDKSINHRQKNKMSFLKKVYLFHFHTPAIKYYANFFIFIFFLLIHAYICLKSERLTIEWSDIFVIAYVTAHLSGEIYQLTTSRGKTFLVKLKHWSESHWNKLDALAILFFFVALGLRFHQKTIPIANVFYAIDGGFWVIRLLHEFQVHQVLGSYVVMIIKMTKDMLYFFVIIFVFLISYGVTMKGLLDPHDNDLKLDEIGQDILLIPFLEIFGQFPFQIPAPNNQTTKFGTPLRSSTEETIAWIYTCIYLLIMNILITNIIIAVFNNTFNYIQENSERIWKFERQELVVEYAERVSIPIPFSIIVHLVLLCRWVLYEFGFIKKVPKTKHILKAYVSNERKIELLDFENKCLTDLLREKEMVTLNIE